MDKAKAKGEPYKDENTLDVNLEFGRSGLESGTKETPSKAVDEAEAKNEANSDETKEAPNETKE